MLKCQAHARIVEPDLEGCCGDGQIGVVIDAYVLGGRSSDAQMMEPESRIKIVPDLLGKVPGLPVEVAGCVLVASG